MKTGLRLISQIIKKGIEDRWFDCHVGITRFPTR